MTEQELAHLEADLTMGKTIEPDRVRALLAFAVSGDVSLGETAYAQGYDDGMDEGTQDNKEQYDSGYQAGYDEGYRDGKDAGIVEGAELTSTPFQ